ncbi:sensor histidine kinase [Caulobacter sp. 17J80-11]|uniref:sensor histidine kinase n=1 Tax=Caulobacter sp. 17J80-11 TaxID=2763502 RepID=UPI001653BC89|nr:PAS domain-containing sensor histidine kinase [Caulobacter sp. 17J80-11]MBC6981418.1 PAS domain-containing protein [Caulobacter sp. 17J80-11]
MFAQDLQVRGMDEGQSFDRLATELERFWGGPAAHAVLETVMDFVPGVVVIVSAPAGRVLYVSEFAGRLMGWPRQELENLSYEQFAELMPNFSLDGRPYTLDERPVGRSLKGETLEDFESYFLDSAGGRVLLRCNTSPIRNPAGEVIGAISVCSDISRQKAREADLAQTAEYNRALHDELAHRVKNHLQVISGLIAVEARGAPAATADFARKIMGVMQSLAAIYQSVVAAGGVGEAEVDAVALIDAVCRVYRTDDLVIEVSAPPGLKLPAERATTIGAVVNEAVCNSYKYAYPDGRGVVEVTVAPSGSGELELKVLDRGVGRAATAHADDGRAHGTKLMDVLARQLGGRIDIADREGGGTAVTLTLPQG